MKKPLICLFALLLVLTHGSWANAQAITLVTLGDSLTAGDGDEYGANLGGFPPRVLARLQTDYPGSSLQNLAVSGLTSDDLINIELSPAIDALNGAPAGQRKLAFVWIGSNDLFGLYNHACDEYYPGDYPTCEQEDLNSYQSNLDTILGGLQGAGAEVYIALLDDQSLRPIMTDPVRRAEVYDNITDQEVARMSQQVARYNEIIRTRANAHGAALVDFSDNAVFTDPALLSGDGNHPNSAGYDVIAERWYNRVMGGNETPAPNPPQPDIRANGGDAVQSLVAGAPLRIDISLASGDALNQPGDWWALRADASGVSYFNLGAGWLPGLLVSHQGPLFDLPRVPIFDSANLPPGEYQFYFGVDTVMNGQLDMAHLYYDSVGVRITASSPAGPRPQPADFQYLGAFRLPGGDTPPLTFAYGGNAMTHSPDGDPGNTDAYPGSLFVMGHDRIAYGGLPDGNQVAEISIPEPRVAANTQDLPVASFLQDFQDVTAGWFTQMEEIPKVGLAYLNHPATGPKIHLTWGQHLQPPDQPSQAWFSPDLTHPQFTGAWFIGNQNLYSVNGYLFTLPTAWADTHVQGRYLATGRMRDGGQGGMGPTLFAYRPWQADGSPPPSGTRLEETPLLLYENVYHTNEITRAMNGYQHPDEWEGGAWINTPSGKSAVLFAGTKATGDKYWYGYMNPRGPEYPCVDSHATDFTTCRLANGAPCPASDLVGCCDELQETCISGRGWWSTRFDAMFILYDPAELALVAAGQLEPWQPQPYASVDIDPQLYLNPPEWDRRLVGTGDQRRYRVGAVAHDRAHGLLYVLEQLADGGKPVVHVWRIE